MHKKAPEIDERSGRLDRMADDYLILGLEINERLGRPEGMAEDHSALGRILRLRRDLADTLDSLKPICEQSNSHAAS
jgi:hypothetical protein